MNKSSLYILVIGFLTTSVSLADALYISDNFKTHKAIVEKVDGSQEWRVVYPNPCDGESMYMTVRHQPEIFAQVEFEGKRISGWNMRLIAQAPTLENRCSHDITVYVDENNTPTVVINQIIGGKTTVGTVNENSKVIRFVTSDEYFK